MGLVSLSREQFFSDVCKALGLPSTPWRLAVFTFWANQEGMPFEETFNPLASTQSGDLNLGFDRGYGPGNWNSVPVRAYRTHAAGVAATVETLENGYYPNILRCLRDQVGYYEAVGPRDFTSWVGSEDYGRRVVDFMNACQEEKMDPKRLWLLGIAWGDFERMVNCYDALLRAGHVPNEGVPAIVGDGGLQDLNGAVQRMKRICALAVSPNYAAAAALLGYP